MISVHLSKPTCCPIVRFSHREHIRLSMRHANLLSGPSRAVQHLRCSLRRETTERTTNWIRKCLASLVRRAHPPTIKSWGGSIRFECRGSGNVRQRKPCAHGNPSTGYQLPTARPGMRHMIKQNVCTPRAPSHDFKSIRFECRGSGNVRQAKRVFMLWSPFSCAREIRGP